MHSLKNLHLLTLVLFISNLAYSQFNLSAQENKKSEYRFCERIILETDRDIYMVGEQINVVCNTIDPIINRTLELNKIVYIEFFTSQNQIIEQIKITMDRGIGNGVINIPRRLTSDRYYIRAYTNYMKNFGMSFFSYSSVSIINPFLEIKQKKEYSSIPTKLEKCVLFPEGGAIIYGHNNVVVGQFTNSNNKPAPCKARLIDENKNVITEFSTNSFGFGNFSFTPEKNKQYKIEATRGDDYISNEIQIRKSGIAIKKISQTNNEIKYKLISHQFSDYPIYLDGAVYGNYFSLKKLTNSDSILSISTYTLPKGIIQFSIRNKNNEILSTRNEYIPSIPIGDILITTDKKNYKSQESIQINFESNLNDTMATSMSISIFLVEPKQIDSIKKLDQLKQLQYNLYPFISNNTIPVQQLLKNTTLLDQLLISTSFNDSLFTKLSTIDYKDLNYLPERNNDLIVGTVTDELNKPIKHFRLIQTWVDTTSLMETVITDTSGNFRLKTNRTGKNELILKPSKNLRGNIKLQDEFFPDFFTLTKEKFSIDLIDSSKLSQQLINLQISDSYKSAEIKKDTSVSNPFYLKPDKLFYIKDYQSVPTLKDFLFEVVPGLLPYTNKGETILKFTFLMSEGQFGDDPLYLLDGFPIFDANQIANLNCSDLKSIGIFYEKYFYQNESFDGIIDIHTNLGDASILKIASNFSHPFIGVQYEKEVETRDLKTHEPNFSTQLYWKSLTQKSYGINKTIVLTAPDNNGCYLIRCSIKTPDGSISYYYSSFRIVGK